MSWRDRPNAPASGDTICRLEEIQDGGAREVVFGRGEHIFRVLLLRSGGEVWAYVNRCPHFGIPVNSRPNKFIFSGARLLMCAHHCAVFRFEDGYCVEGPAEGEFLDSIPVTLEDGAIRVAAAAD